MLAIPATLVQAYLFIYYIHSCTKYTECQTNDSPVEYITYLLNGVAGRLISCATVAASVGTTVSQ